MGLTHLESIAEEARYINAAMHIINVATLFPFFPYYANSCDQIAGNAERYHMTTKRDRNIWPKIAFDVDLSLSLFEWQWTDSRLGPEGDLARAWHDLMLGKRSLLHTAARILYHSARARDFAYFRRLRALRLVSRGTGSLAVGRGKPAVLALEGDFLRARRPGWLARNRRILLTEADKALLRRAYFVCKTSEVKEALAREHGLTAGEVDALLHRHVALGTIVTHRSHLVSTVRDPEYLAQRRAAAHASQDNDQGATPVKLRVAVNVC